MENSRQLHNLHGCARTHPQHLTISPREEHFTQVLIRAESKSGRLHHYIKDEKEMYDALVKGCSSSLEDGSPYCGELKSFYKDHGIRPLKLNFMGNEVKRKISDGVSPPKIEPLELEIGDNKQVIAKIFYCKKKHY